MAFGAPLDESFAWRVMRVKLFLLGHSFESIDNMGLQDYSDVIGYQSAEAKAKAKQQKRQQMASQSKGKRG